MAVSIALLVGITTAAEPASALPSDTFPLPADPAHIRVDGDRLYLSSFRARKLVLVSPTREAPLAELPLDAWEFHGTDSEQGEYREIRRAAGGDLILAGGKIFVGQVFHRSLLVIDQATFTPLRRLPLGGQGQLAASADGRTVFYASHLKPEFHIINTKTCEYRTIPYPPRGVGIGCVAVSPDGGRLYLGIQRRGEPRPRQWFRGGTGFLAVYDLVKDEYAGTVFLHAGDSASPWSFAFSPDGDRLYIGTFQSEAGILVVDTETLRLTGNIPFKPNRPNPTYKWVDMLGIAVYDRWLIAPLRHNRELAIVDLDTHKTVAEITFAEPSVLSKAVVSDGRIFLHGDAPTVSVVRGQDLSKLLAGVDPKTDRPLRLRLEPR